MIESAKLFILRFDQRRRFFRSLQNAHRILDVGCGTGKNALEIRQLHPSLEYHGVDLLQNAHVPSFVHYQQVDLEQGSLPYPDDHFDAILVIHVLEHLHRPLALGSEIRRVLRKNGRVYVETPNWISLFLPSLRVNRGQVGTINFFDDHTHVKPWSKHGLHEFLEGSCRLRVESVGTVRNWLRMPTDPFVLLVGLLSSNRGIAASAIWNLTGWRIFGVGRRHGD